MINDDFSEFGSLSVLQQLTDNGFTLAEAQEKLDAWTRSGIKQEELKSAVDGLLSRGEMLVPDSEYSNIIPAKDVVVNPIQWLLEPYIQIGAITILQGLPGIGKTSYVCWLASLVSKGIVPDQNQISDQVVFKYTYPGNTLMLSGEDDPGILKQRYLASGGDINRLFFMEDCWQVDLSNPESLASLEKRIFAFNIQFLILDPLQLFLGQKVDFYKANSTRPILEGVVAMAKRTNSAVLIICHTSKSAGLNSPVLRSLGSTDIPATSRSILHVERSEQGDGLINAYHVKSNSSRLGRTISYRIGDSGETIFQGFTDELLSGGSGSGRDAPVQSKCEQFILTALDDGPIQSKNLDAMLLDSGFSRSTANRSKAQLKDDERIRYEKRENADGVKAFYVMLKD